MAGVAGLEPAHARIKTLCLTNLATPQSLKFIFLSMAAVVGPPFYQGRLYITMLGPGTRHEFVPNQPLKST
jgi:hypothetical protein